MCWKRLPHVLEEPLHGLREYSQYCGGYDSTLCTQTILVMPDWLMKSFCFALDWALGVHGLCVPNPVLFVRNRIEREKCSMKANWRAFWKPGVMVVCPIFKLSQCKAHPRFQGRWNVLIFRVSGWHFLAFPSCPIVNIWSHYWNSKKLK
jgi:hypothetical protein